MNSNTSAAFPTSSMVRPSASSTSTTDTLANIVSRLEPITPTRTELNITITGSSSSNPNSPTLETPLSPTQETPFATPSSNLKSSAKPHEILESLPLEPRILRVSKEDIDALCQVINEFKEQCNF